tara:strand:- start:423 stop:911 length:489 start_codon:yes stop_codon:yes gene_type:complete
MNWFFWYAYVLTSPQKEALVADDWKKQFNEISEWLANKGYTVRCRTGVEDCVLFNSKMVYINSRNHPETKYYTLLHECGHVLIDKDAVNFEKGVPMYARSEDGRKARSKAYRVSTVAEELEAWKRGRRLALRLGHTVDDKKYDKQITDNVMSYIEWAADGGG